MISHLITSPSDERDACIYDDKIVCSNNHTDAFFKLRCFALRVREAVVEAQVRQEVTIPQSQEMKVPQPIAAKLW
jgi:hypothetical protein